MWKQADYGTDQREWWEFDPKPRTALVSHNAWQKNLPQGNALERGVGDAGMPSHHATQSFAGTT